MRLAEVQSHVTSMQALLQIVGAMRSLAGMRLHEAVLALEGVRRYGNAMTGALHQALALNPSEADSRNSSAGTRPEHGRAWVLCASEHGFVGAFNEHLLRTLESSFASGDALLVIGSRGASLAIDRGHRVSWQYPMATHLVSIPETVQQVLRQIYDRIEDRQVQRVEVLFSTQQPGGGSSVERRRLLPLDPPSRVSAPISPFHYLAPSLLLEKLTGEYLFALLTETLTESLASENSARFAAMTAAHDAASRKLDQLQQDASLARQDEITTELLDLMVGELAISSSTRSVSSVNES